MSQTNEDSHFTLLLDEKC